jgi:hypothetical protein
MMIAMARTSPLAIRLRREHGAVQHPDRRDLERDGWRTTLDYRENHVRGRDGLLRQLHVAWHAEAEQDLPDGRSVVISATASSVDRVWSRLRMEAELTDVRLRRRDEPVDSGAA